MSATIAKVGMRSKHHLAWHAGTCAVCKQLVPVRPGDTRPTGHYPLDPEDAYYGNADYYCRGSSLPVSVLHDQLWHEVLGEAPAVGRRAVLTITFHPTVSGEDVRRLARAWAARISEKQAAESVHVKTHETTQS